MRTFSDHRRPMRRRRLALVAVALGGVLTAAACATQFAAGGSSHEGEPSSQPASAIAVAGPSFDTLFADAGVEGTIVIRRAGDGRTWTIDPVRAAQRRPPASTFKVLNALIALETGAVAGADADVFAWDGVRREVEAWNQDHTLRSAFNASAVWVFQDVARRIGAPRMAFWVGAADYGDERIGGRQDLDRFWLRGPLSISPDEQIAFLDRFASGVTPFSDAAESVVADLMKIDQGPGWTLRGKTGWADGETPALGWFVGWLEAEESRYVFALNIDMPNPEADAPKRIELARAALTRIGAAELGDAWRDGASPAR